MSYGGHLSRARRGTANRKSNNHAGICNIDDSSQHYLHTSFYLRFLAHSDIFFLYPLFFLYILRWSEGRRCNGKRVVFFLYSYGYTVKITPSLCMYIYPVANILAYIRMKQPHSYQYPGVWCISHLEVAHFSPVSMYIPLDSGDLLPSISFCCGMYLLLYLLNMSIHYAVASLYS